MVDVQRVAPSVDAVPDDATVVVRDLHVRYRIAGRQRPSLRDVFSRREREDDTVVHAVRGINLVAREGESIGFIGPNGAGKSTTMQAIAGLLPASSGEVLCRSEPVLLGVNAAMENRLTGRQNIELGCLALGMTKDQVERRFDRIVSFSGLEDAIDRQMKTYSSGMRARLHFAVATEIKPEVLLIDEALSVGDQRFRRKSRSRVNNMLAKAGTVFIVSHGIGTLRRFCNRMIWMEDGLIVMDGEPDEVIDAYQHSDPDYDESEDLDDDDD